MVFLDVALAAGHAEFLLFIHHLLEALQLGLLTAMSPLTVRELTQQGVFLLEGALVLLVLVEFVVNAVVQLSIIVHLILAVNLSDPKCELHAGLGLNHLLNIFRNAVVLLNLFQIRLSRVKGRKNNRLGLCIFKHRVLARV